MSSTSSHDLGYIEFKVRLDTLRYQHAVASCGQILLHLVLKTLICGNISNISDCVRVALGSNTQYKNSFTREEQQLLKEGKHETWDICLLYKVIQKACGLELGDNYVSTHSAGGTRPLERLITKVKVLRNELVHKFELVINKDQLENDLEELADLARSMTSALVDYAHQQGKELSAKESEEIMNNVVKITDDVKREINESDDESDEEDDYAGAVAEGQVVHDPSLKTIFENLEEKFWTLAGMGIIE